MHKGEKCCACLMKNKVNRVRREERMKKCIHLVDTTRVEMKCGAMSRVESGCGGAHLRGNQLDSWGGDAATRHQGPSHHSGTMIDHLISDWESCQRSKGSSKQFPIWLTSTPRLPPQPHRSPLAQMTAPFVLINHNSTNCLDTKLSECLCLHSAPKDKWMRQSGRAIMRSRHEAFHLNGWFL